MTPTTAPTWIPTRDAISRTEAAVRGHLRRTPVITLPGGELGCQAESVALKLELLQHTGSFKARGAFANLMLRAVPPGGVVAASGGNHGAAVAHAARELGVACRIFVPRISSPAKIERIRSYGADLTVGGSNYGEAFAASEVWRAAGDYLSVHPYDQPETILGSATLGKELSEQVGGIDTILVAVGGGGLLAGIASWFQGTARVIAVEPSRCPTLTSAFAAGKPVVTESGGIAADSLGPHRVGEHVFPIAARFASEVLLVSDEQIRRAQEWLWSRLRIVAEPGGAAALAALLSGVYQPRAGERIATLICGGNCTAVDFERVTVPTASTEERA